LVNALISFVDLPFLFVKPAAPLTHNSTSPKINTLLLEDDPHWQLILTKLIEQTPVLNLVGTGMSAMATYALMANQDIDLLISDIELPDMSGLAFMKSLRQPPMVIFVTSHRDYALDCYEVSPVDFLLKPLDPPRFLASIEKVRQRWQTFDDGPVPIEPYFFVRENQQYIQIAYRDVLYMQAQDNLLNIVTTTGTYSPLLSIAKLEEQLNSELFLRVHRAFVVQRSAISQIGRNDIILTSGHSIPIGDQYRTQLTRKHIGNRVVSRTN
jgi:DNA-binding LytR/AlgR family response regulator